MSEIIQTQSLRTLAQAWIGRGWRVIAPVQVKPGVVLYRPVQSADVVLFDGFVRPANTIKEFLFPRHEVLYRYRFVGKRIELADEPLPEQPQLILAARPCDAAGVAILDDVFNWDCADAFYNRRRELTTIVTLACAEPDDHCFCTSVGCGPEDTRGADAMLLPLGEGAFEARCLTDKGRELLGGQTASSDRSAEALAGPPSRIDLPRVKEFLADGFENPVWPQLNVRCLGCGACAYMCPTCHCFDIVDEGNAAGGVRARNWDACQFAMFTHHASGHNPRHNQAERGRQRIMHKFAIYEQKFGKTLCTGCGNCSRNCPVGLGVLPVLEQIEQAQQQPAGE
ncbi:MAG: 4Fe-4S dicluster domain-containing protein [Planctomycetota bacterium]